MYYCINCKRTDIVSGQDCPCYNSPIRANVREANEQYHEMLDREARSCYNVERAMAADYDSWLKACLHYANARIRTIAAAITLDTYVEIKNKTS